MFIAYRFKQHRHSSEKNQCWCGFQAWCNIAPSGRCSENNSYIPHKQHFNIVLLYVDNTGLSPFV